MEIKGKITHELPVVSGTKKDGGTWSKQSFVITEETDKYPKSLCFEVWNDKVPVTLGEVCTIHFETKTSEYNGKWYNEVRAWKKEGASATTPSQAHAQAPVSAPPMSTPAPSPAPVAGGKLTMNQATYEKAKAAIEALASDGDKLAKFHEIQAKYELTIEQGMALESLCQDLPF